MTLAETLQRTPLFAGVDTATVRFFAENSTQKHYQKGEPLFSMGDPATHLFFIIDGRIKLYRINKEGKETIINIFTSKETFAEIAVLGPAQKYPVSALAIDDAHVLEIPHSLFMDTIGENKKFAFSIIETIAARQEYFVQMIEHLAVKTPAQRLGCFLLRFCPPQKTENIEIPLPYDKGLIAGCLGIQPETFSRALKKLETQGVSSKGRTVLIKDVATLKLFCDITDQDITP